MTKNNFVINTMAAGFVSLTVFLTSCTETSVSNTANKSNTNQATVISNTNAANTNVAPNAAAPNTATANLNSNSAPTGNLKSAPAVKEPTPQIGSGANDLMVFTQLRSALSADQELQNGVIIEIKEGNVTLSGKVSSAAQKTKAEQLIKAVSGVKTVKNNIGVSN